MSSVLDNIGKNDNNFSFISTFFDLVGNKEFKDAEISTLYTKAETSETSIWRSLSAVAELLGSTFYNNTLNFIDNITNVDLCKVRLLQSMISLLGIKYTIFNDILYMPLDIQNLIDIFSVKREYLTCYTKLNNSFVNNMLSGSSLDLYDDAALIFSGNEAAIISSKLVNEDEYLSYTKSSVADINKYRANYHILYPELSDFWTNDLSCLTAIDDSKFNSYISSIYKGVLYNKLCATYNNKMHHLIYENLSNNILLSNFALPNDIENLLNSYKLLYNIPATFNVQNEVDKYENGLVELSDYTNLQISALQMEIDRRKQAYINEEPKTRYKFYREREVKEYTQFIENEYSIVQQKLYTDSTKNVLSVGGYYGTDIRYDLDPKYIELYNLPADELVKMTNYKLFIKTVNEQTGIELIVINDSIVNTIVEKLVEITNGIREVRETIKMQCLKYFMRGTKLLLNSIVCEYLRSNIVNTLAEVSCLDKSNYVFENDNNSIDIVEYIDPTNYYNISVDSDVELSNDISAEISSLNLPYWKQNSTLNAIGAVDGTNLFVKLPTIDALNFIFNDASMSVFYNDMLKNKFDVPNTLISTLLGMLKDFLIKLFELGAETTFLSNDVFHTYDSCIAKNVYDATVEEHNSNIGLVNSYYGNVLSIINDSSFSEASALSSMVDLNLPLQQQLSIMYEYLDGTIYETQCKDISALCAILALINVVQENISLSSLSALLSSRYELINDVKREAYDYACKTDSYVLQQEYNKLLDNYTAGYLKLSTEFNTIVEAKYIPDDFKQEDLTLTTLLSSLCLCLSALPAALRPAGIRAIEDLSTTLNDINKLSAKIELEIMLETLSSQFEEELGYKQTEIDVLRSSDVFKKRESMFKQYSGTDSADVPFYYMSNARHPSYMLHPCLSNYVESEEYDYSVDNIANLLNADESKKYMLEHLSNLMDKDGYFINIWQNPLNTNTDYATKYELASHRTTTGTENEVIGYDGIFYPSALHDFLNNKTFTEDVSKWNLVVDENTGNTILDGNFIESLSGRQCYNTLSGLYQHVIWNPWYKHLDLSKNEALHIAELLLRYRNFINSVAKNNTYDIYRYGLDAFGNSYILIKKGIKDLDEDVKRLADGCLWIRIKDHPIAFPAYEFNSSSDINPFKSELQITYIEQSDCNGEILAFKEIKNYYTGINVPSIQDFTFAINGNILILNGKMKGIDASYPVIVNVDLSYNYDASINRELYFHNIVNSSNPIYAIIPQTTITSQLSNWIFLTYFYTDDKVGVIYSNIKSKLTVDNKWNNTISMVGAYYNTVDNTVKQKMLNMTEVDSVETVDSALENVCIDANGNIVTIAYLTTLPNTLVNYLSIDVPLSDMSALYGNDTSDPYLSAVSVKTKEYEIGPRSFIEIKSKSYVKYTDAGFFGLLQPNDECKLNNIGDTNIVKHEIPKRGVYKYLILADATPIENMIDYRQVILVRPYEDTTLASGGMKKMTTPRKQTDYYPITYMSAHFYEALNSPTTNDLSSYNIISSNEDVFEPAKFRDILFGREPSFKIDEKYIDTVKSLENILSDGYPYMCLSAPDIFENPYGQSYVSYGNCMLLPSDVEDFPALSIQWGKWKENDVEYIKLDFNPMFNSLTSTSLAQNKFNCMKLFLNLDKPGEAGIIDIYDDPINNSSFNKLATYYIKNMSDDKPKFMLSADFLQKIEYPGFLTEEGDVKPNAILSAEEDQLGKIAFEQKRLNISRSM